MTGACYVVRKEQCGGIQLWGLIQTKRRMHLAPRRESLHESSRHRYDLHVGPAPRVGPRWNSSIALPRRPNSDDQTPAKTIGHQLTSNDMTGAGYVVRKEQCGGIQLWGLIQTIGRMHSAPRRESLHESSYPRHALHVGPQHLVWA